LTISVVESSKQRRLVVEGRVVAPWSDELKAACERAGSGLDGRELVIDLKNHNDDRPTGRKPASGTDEAGGQMPRLWRVYECDFETGRPQIAQEWSAQMNRLMSSYKGLPAARMFTLRIAFALALAATLTGCAVGPKYRRP